MTNDCPISQVLPWKNYCVTLQVNDQQLKYNMKSYFTVICYWAAVLMSLNQSTPSGYVRTRTDGLCPRGHSNTHHHLVRAHSIFSKLSGFGSVDEPIPESIPGLLLVNVVHPAPLDHPFPARKRHITEIWLIQLSGIADKNGLFGGLETRVASSPGAGLWNNVMFRNNFDGTGWLWRSVCVIATFEFGPMVCVACLVNWVVSGPGCHSWWFRSVVRHCVTVSGLLYPVGQLNPNVPIK